MSGKDGVWEVGKDVLATAKKRIRRVGTAMDGAERRTRAIDRASVRAGASYRAYAAAILGVRAARVCPEEGA